MTERVRSDTSNPFKEIRIVNFSGNVDDWPKWSKKFMAAAKVKKNCGYYCQIRDSASPK